MFSSFQTACQLDPENLALAEEKNIAESLLENKPYASGISMLEIKKRIKKNNLQDIALLKQLPPTGEKHLGEKYLHLLNDERIKSFLNKPEPEVTEKEPEESDFTLDNIQIPPSRILPDKLTEAQIEALEIKKKEWLFFIKTRFLVITRIFLEQVIRYYFAEANFE